MTEVPKTMEAQWNEFIRRHRGIFALFAIASITALVAAIRVFIWFSGNAQTSGLAPASLAQWTLGDIVNFALNLIFWEIVFVGVPVIVGVVIAWWWWRRLPSDERTGLRLSDGRQRRAGGDGASFLFFIAFCIKVYADGNWNTAISSWTFDYVVSSAITIFVWALIIVVILAGLGLAWWIRRPRT